MSIPIFFFLTSRRPRRSTLFPYTTLFRSMTGFSVYVGKDKVLEDLKNGFCYGTEDWTPSMANKKYEAQPKDMSPDRKSTRLNSSHANISYSVFCLKKKIAANTSAAPSFPT